MDKIPERVLVELSNHVKVDEVYKVLSEGLRSGFSYMLEFEDWQYPLRNLSMLEDLRNHSETQ